MDRNREARRATIVGSNGFNRRRHRMSSLRDSPDEDGGLELHESFRSRDRVKKDRDRDRERDHERERERDLRERSNRSKRRRAERLTKNRGGDITGDGTSDESVDDDEDEEDEEHPTSVVGSGVRLVTPPLGSILNHHHHNGGDGLTNQQNSSNFGENTNTGSNNNDQLQHRKTFPPGSSASKAFRSPPQWKSGDEMIGVSVPRKARSASTKRSNDWISSSSNNNSGGAASGRDQTHQQDSISPARHGSIPSTSAAAAPVSHSSNAKMLKTNANTAGGPKPKPPKASSKPNSSNPEELEIEIAEVLYGLMTQSHGPSAKKEETRETNRSNADTKSRNSSPISNSSNLYSSMGINSIPLSVIAPKRKRPRQVPDSSIYCNRSCPPVDLQVKSELSSPLEKTTLENGNEMRAISADSHELLETKPVESSKMDSDFKGSCNEKRNISGKVEVSSSSPKERESLVTREEIVVQDSSVVLAIKSNLVETEKGSTKDTKFPIDLMAPPPQTRSSPERDAPDGSLAGAANPKLVLSMDSTAPKKVQYPNAEEHTVKESIEESDSQKIVDDKGRVVVLQLDLEKPEREVRNKPLQSSSKQTQQQIQLKPTREEKSGAVSLPLSMASWPSGLPPVGYVAPFQGVMSIDGNSVAQPHLQPLVSQPKPKRCATHCHIAKNIQFLQNVMKMSPLWAGSPGAASLFGSKSCNVNPLPPVDIQGGNSSLRASGYNTSVDKGTSLPNNGKEKSGQVSTPDPIDSGKQQILIQQTLPPVAAGGLLGPAFIFPLNQQALPAVGARNGAVKTATPGVATNASTVSSPVPASGAATMSFSYPSMVPANESQYLAILPNNGYPFPVPMVGAPPNYHGAPPQGMQLLNGSSFYSSQMILPSQLQQLQAQASASATSSSQKVAPSQQPQPQNSGNVNLHNFVYNKNQPPPPQQSHNVQPQRPRNQEGETVSADHIRNMYGQNLGLHNFTLMAAAVASSPPLPSAAAAVSSTEKKAYPVQQKASSESLPPTFAMSFGSNINGTTQAIDMASVAQNHAIFQSSAELARHNIQTMSASQVAQKNNFRILEDNRSTGLDSSTNGEDKKLAAGKSHGIGGSQVVSSTNWSSSCPTSNSIADATISSATTQTQIQREQFLQLKQQMASTPVNRSKVPVTSNGNSMYSELNSSSPTKFRTGVSGSFLQNQIHSSPGSPNQQQSLWKNSLRPATSQPPSSLALAALKSMPPQQLARPSQPPVLTQISFGGNQKPLSTTSQGQGVPNTNQSPSATPMVAAPPATSYISKGGTGSPQIATSGLTASKIGQTTAPSAQSSKNPPSITSQKSGSMLGNLHIASSANNGAKKYPQLVFPNPYMQSQHTHSPSTSSSTSSHGGGGYVSKRRPDHQQTPLPTSSGSMAAGVISLNSPVSETVTNDSAKATAAATFTPNVSQFPAGLSYLHPVPSAVQVKHAEQKQPPA